MLCYRSTPLAWCNISPAELLMGRKVRTNLPQLEEQLYPKWSDFEHFRNKDHEFKEKQKSNFDQRHDTEVWIKTETETTPGRVIIPAATPRSYIVETPRGGQVRRNRAHLNPRASTTTPAQPPTQAIPADNPTPNRIMTRSRTGTIINPPQRFNPSSRRGDVT